MYTNKKKIIVKSEWFSQEIQYLDSLFVSAWKTGILWTNTEIVFKILMHIKVHVSNIQMLFFVFIIMRRYDNKPNTSNVLSFFSLHNYLVSFSFLENAEVEYKWNIKGHNSIRPLNLDSPTRLQHHQCHHHRIIPRRFLSPHHSL